MELVAQSGAGAPGVHTFPLATWKQKQVGLGKSVQVAGEDNFGALRSGEEGLAGPRRVENALEEQGN